MDSPIPPDAKPKVPTGPAGTGRDGVAASIATGPNGSRPAGAVVSRAYPKPPGLVIRLLLMCLRPETWPEMARYPTRYTLFPLAWAILLAALLAGVSQTARLWQHTVAFARVYDAHYPAMEFTSDAKLRLKGDGKLDAPIRFDDNGSIILIDPTGKSSPENTKVPGAILITDKNVNLIYNEDGGSWTLPLSVLAMGNVPAADKPVTIDGHWIEDYLNHTLPFSALFSSLLLIVGNALWAVLMMFLLSPLVMLAAAGPAHGEGPDRRLMLPRRAAYRMAGALLVPLLILGGGLQAAGHSVASLLGPEGATLFWFFSAAALAIWTGTMAKKMYGPKPRTRQ